MACFLAVDAPTQQILNFQPRHPFVGHALAVKVSYFQSCVVQNNNKKTIENHISLAFCFVA
jgi:hypothetical protein